MRNPRSIATTYYARPPQLQLKRSSDTVRVERLELGNHPPQVFEIMSDNGGFVEFLKFLKFSPEEIARTTKFVSVIGKIAATGNWVYGAYKTTVAILTFLGILKREEPQELQILKKLAEKIETMYKHMEIEAAKAPFVQAVGWRTKLSGMNNAIQNASTSRSQENIDDLRAVKRELQDVLLLIARSQDR